VVAAGVVLGVVDGLPVVRQRADAAGADRLRQIGAQLERAAHPGVVRVVASGPRGDGWELVTEHGGLALAAARLPSADAVTELGCAVAATLADLHERGVVHGRLDATRILLGRDGRPVLCGLAPAGDAGEAAPMPTDDVAALGAVLTEVLAAIEPTGAAARARHDVLRGVLSRAQAEPATRRPSARRLAGELAPVGPRSPEARPARRRTSRRPHRTGAMLAGALAAAVVAVTVLVARRPSTARPPPVTATTSTSTSVPIPCVATAQGALRSSACGHDVVVDGPAVLLDGRRYVVGLQGDEVAVGDWDCAGGLRAAVLRPSTGEVRVFGEFTADRALLVARAERVLGPRSLGVRDDDGCPTLGVLDPEPSDGA
jgi:hypothetical protein